MASGPGPCPRAAQRAMSWSSSSATESGGLADGDPGREGVDRSPPGADAGEGGASTATAPGPVRCGGRHGGRWPRAASCRPRRRRATSSAQLVEPRRAGAQAARDVESADALGQQGVVADAAGDHGVGHADQHHAFEPQAPGAAEGSHEHAVAEAAVGELRGVEARSLRARSRTARRNAPWSVRADTASSSPRASTAPRTCSVAPRARRAGHDAGVGVEVAVEEPDRPRGVGRPRPARWRRVRRRRGRRRRRRAPRPRRRSSSWSRRQVLESLGPLRRARAPRPASDDSASHRLVGTRRRSGPDTMGAVREPRHDLVARPVRCGQLEQAEQRGPRHRPVQAPTSRARWRRRRPRPAPGAGPGRSRGPGDGGSAWAHDGTPASTEATHGAHRGAHLFVGVGAGAHLGERCRSPGLGHEPRARWRSRPPRRRGPGARRRQGAGVESTSTGPRASRAPRRPGGGVGRGLGQVDGVGEPASVEVGAHLGQQTAQVADAAAPAGQGAEGGRGAAPELGHRVAERHQPPGVPDEIGQPPPRRQGRGADGLEVDGGPAPGAVPAPASTGHAEVADQLVHRRAVDVGDAASRPRARAPAPRARRGARAA